MFGLGKILSTVTKVVTLPLDVVDSIGHAALGESKSTPSDNPIIEVRDDLCDALEELDE